MWKTVKLGDVLELIQNGVNCDQDKSGNGVKITRIETIADANINYEKTGFASLSEAQKERAKLKIGDILFSHINSAIHVGKSAIYNGEEPLFHGINLLRMRTTPDVDSHYFNFFLRSLFWSGYWKNACKQSVNQASVNQTDIKSINFSFPPLAEQQRIVEKLDKAFEEIDRAIEATERRREELVAIYDSKVTEILSRAMIECPHTKLSKLCSRITVGYVGKMSDQYLEDGIKFLRSQSIRPYRISHEGLLYISERFNESISKSQLRRGDVCVVRTGYPGTAAVVTEEWDGANCSDLVIFTPLKSLHSEFLELFFNADFGKSLVLGKVVGAAQKHFNVTSAKDVDFPEVPIEKQKQIVSISRELRSICDEAISIAVHKRAELIKLKTAILAQELEGPAR
jgi:type I restriction enzyme S subunit